MFIMKETGCDKWIAPKTHSGYSSTKSDARKFDAYVDAIDLLNRDKRYKGLKFSTMHLEYDNKPFIGAP